VWKRLAAIAVSALSGVAATAYAADVQTSAPASIHTRAPGFFVHVGPAAVVLNESATMFAAGYKLDGANISIKPQATLALEAGYFLSPNFAVSFTGGVPPFAKIEGAGTMAGVGRVGATTYGPMTLTAHYHFTDMGRLQPYLGAGLAFMYVFDEKDGAMSQLKVENAVGFAFQVGADFMITDQWGLFIDVKKAILRTEAKGFYGPFPIDADIKLDPLVVHGGVSLRF
jgi:outer membrane protein